jgi:hypothetical protein
LIQERPIVLGAISGAPIPIAQVEVLFIEVDPSLLPQVWVIVGLKLSFMVTALSWLLLLLSVMQLSMLLSEELNIPKHLKSAKSTSIAFADCVMADIRVARYAIPAKVTTIKYKKSDLIVLSSKFININSSKHYNII